MTGVIHLILAIALLAALTVSCKQRGTATVQLEFEQGCAPLETATAVNVYALRGATCGGCECGGCFDLCGADDCVLACGGGPCPIEDGAPVVELDPTEPGLYAVIVELTDVDDRNVRRLLASACAELALEEDGTSDLEVTATGTCCGTAP